MVNVIAGVTSAYQRTQGNKSSSSKSSMVARQPFESSNLGLVRKWFLKCFLLSQLKAAEEHKLKGIIIFSDPEQYAPTGTSYPDSWYLPKDGVQRGTVLRIKGDPLSNGYPALGESLLSYQQTSLYTLYHQYAPIAENKLLIRLCRLLSIFAGLI